MAGGFFFRNEASDGGVAFVNEEGWLLVEGGTYSYNEARNGGGVFFIDDGGQIKVSYGEQIGDIGGGVAFCMPWARRPLVTGLLRATCMPFPFGWSTGNRRQPYPCFWKHGSTCGPSHFAMLGLIYHR